jgi:hypothetical protein
VRSVKGKNLMTISRRKFLGRSSVFSLAALFPLTSHARQSAAVSATLGAAGHDLLSRLTSESFSENLNTTFEIQVSALNAQELELIEVSKKRAGRSTEAFDVFFLGPKKKKFTQGTYMIRHARMGTFPLFVVPVGNGNHGVCYQAVFSRLR